jgi:hypothetical protein
MHMVISPERGVLVDLEALDGQPSGIASAVYSVVFIAGEIRRRYPDRRCGVVVEPEKALDCGSRAQYEPHNVQS